MPDATPSLRNTFPGLAEAQATYLGAIDSLLAPDRKTHELIRLACSVIQRNPAGIERHAMLAAEFDASWEDVVGTLVLTQPSFGFVPAIEAFPHARRGFESGLAAKDSDEDDDD
jgi:alkylhydroperoxidase/carboxymuconolactone decarboxylase family protein YurZ